jgi:nuclear protein localization family protein 4
LHDQSIAKASVSLNKLVRALPDNMPESSGSKVKGKGKATDVEAFENLGKWLSDWHLLAYLDTVGIFDKVRWNPLSHTAYPRRA